MRRLVLVSILLLVLVLALPFNWFVGGRQTPPPLPVAPTVGHGQRMANLNLAGLTAPTLVLRLQQMAQDGMQVVRLRLPWDEIQPEPDLWRWDKVDRAIATAREQNLEVVLVLDGAPAWAVAPTQAGVAEDTANPLAPPHDVRDFGQFAATAAQRYRGDIAAYQIWDEPNIAPHWGARWADPHGYFHLLREAANSVHSADPDAPIMLAALAPTTANDGANLSDLTYLHQLYSLGAAEFFDIVAAQAYGFDQAPTADPAPDQLNFRRPELIYEIMQGHGDGQTAVWITAWGWWTPLPTQTIEQSPWRGIDASQLSHYLQTGYRLAFERWPWAGPMAWVTYSLNPGEDPLRLGFVQRVPAGDHTLTGETLADLVEPTLALSTGSHSLQDTAIPAEGWRASPAAADPNQSGAELIIPFVGSSIALEIQRGSYWATLYAWIDGEPAPLLPKDGDGNTYIILHDPDNGIETISLATNLGPGKHVLRLVSSGGWGQWPLRRIVVDHRSWPKAWPTAPITALLLVAILVVAYLWIRALRTPAGSHLVQGLDAAWASGTDLLQTQLGNWTLGLLLALTLAFYFLPSIWMSLVLLGALSLILALRLDLIPALVLLLLPFYLRPKTLGTIGISTHELMIWLGFILWLGREALSWLTKRIGTEHTSSDDQTPGRHDGSSFSLNNLDYPVLLLLLTGLIATVGAERFGYALYDFRTVFLTPFLFYWLLTRTTLRQSLDLKTLCDAFVLGALMISLIGLGQFFGGEAYFVQGVPRVYALFGSANNLALYLGRVLPVLIAVTALGHSPRRWLYFAALIPIAAAAFLTFSKGLLLISIPATLLLLALLEARLRRLALILFILGAIALIPFLGAPRFTDLLNTNTGTTFLRLQLWQSAWRMFVDHPWLGVGPDNFLYAYRSTYALPVAWEELQLSHPHNVFLDLLTRAGIVGFLAGIWLLVGTLYRGLRLLLPAQRRFAVPSPFRSPAPASTRSLSPQHHRYYLGLWVGLAAGLLHGLIDNSLFLVDLAILTYLVVAISQRLWTDQASKKD